MARLERRIRPAELAALDHFHTGGLHASRELLDLLSIRSEHRVLDIGAGLAGAALLNRLTGLEDRIALHRGSALELPFPDDSFDVVWMQNVGMNIADKRTLYRDIHRVLRPGGRFAFQEMTAGDVAPSCYPLPWASDPADNCLVSAAEMQAMLDECGLVLERLEDTSEAHLGRTLANATPAAPGQLGLGVYVDDLAQKASNARRSLEEGQVRLT